VRAGQDARVLRGLDSRQRVRARRGGHRKRAETTVSKEKKLINAQTRVCTAPGLSARRSSRELRRGGRHGCASSAGRSGHARVVRETRSSREASRVTYVYVSGDVRFHSPATEIFGDELGARGRLEVFGLVVVYTVAVNIVARDGFTHRVYVSALYSAGLEEQVRVVRRPRRAVRVKSGAGLREASDFFRFAEGNRAGREDRRRRNARAV
jgi:hypothetical protein